MMRTHTPCTTRLVTALVVVSLFSPNMALAQVRVDDTDLEYGSNSVGGGTATYGEGNLDMEGVTADTVTTDEDLTVNFNGDNDIENFQVTDDASVVMNFDGENEVEDIEAYDTSDVTINMNEHNDFEDIEAYDESSIMVNVTGETSCEAIKGYDDATVTVEGTTCPQKDILTVGEGEGSERIGTERGDLTIKDVTVVMDSTEAQVTSKEGNVWIGCSKIMGGEDNKRTDIHAGGTMFIGGSVIDIAGNVSADGALTIRRSDVDVQQAEGDDSPYRIWSRTGIELIEERNGVVREGELDGQKVWYVDTDDGDDVHLRSALRPCYYGRCGEPSHTAAARVPGLPKTGDMNASWTTAISVGTGVTLLTVGLWLRRRQEDAK